MAMTAATLSTVMWKIDRLLGMPGSSGLSSLESAPVEEALNSLRSILPKLLSAANVVEEEELPEAVHDAAGEWMDKVKAVAYDAEDVLDDCEHELLLQLQLDAAEQPAAVGDSVVSTAAGASSVLLHLSDIRRRFEGIMTEHAQTLNLRLEGIAMMPSPTILSAVPPPSDPIQPTVYGREDDMEKIVQLLLSSSPQQQHGDQHLPIIAVVGDEGIGKTTLCRLVYTDPRICEHFDFRIWASASQQCLAMDAIAGDSNYRGIGDLAHLSHWELTHNRFLLMVDDLEPEDLGFWESVYNHLSVGVRGSQVLLTSRTEEHLAKVMAAATAMPSYHRLGHLTEESSWSLFKDYALHGRDLEVSSSLEAVGRQICRKCGGSPLLLKMMGALLHSDAASEEEHWEKVLLISRCWKSQHRAIQAVPGFCFRRLPSHLRRCLVYCSLFPKGYPFTRDQLVRLWMAQDFLPPEEGKQMEDVGNGIIDRLLWCSFLEHPPIGEQTLVMPGPIHDLARSHLEVTECSRKDDVEEISMDARHSSLVPCNTCNGEIQLPSYSKPVHLKSCFLVKSWGHAGDGFYFPAEDVFRLQIPGDFFLSLSHLSSLDLSYSNVEELPESVGMLTHLRYLSLNHTYIKELPESIATLHSLWTLELRSCMQLRALPKAFKKLTSLRHLDTQALRFPLFDIGELTDLRTLTRFIVGRGRRSSASTISQLKHLGGLRGELHIIGLGQVLLGSSWQR
ncbi:hypothetical protein Taro_045579 [Colocasia esculenta]|uniref:Uncharacterized protein n=1 Tax=Colocasia esculenta TaxID=4460 RepID=A0A843WRN1_COLES|nr:hypothetical protein [Colocasia esculenta]